LSGQIALLTALYLGAPRPRPTAIVSPTSDTAAAAREQRFLELLRTYPDRPSAETFQRVARLVDEGDFPQRDRAEYWIGSARLSTGDRRGARAWFERVARDYPGSVWQERSWLGLAEAAAQERDYSAALALYRRAQQARDPAVREMGRISAVDILRLRARQRWAWACGIAALVIGAFFAIDGLRRGARPWPLPSEARIVLPVLCLIALLSIRIDPAPRAAVFQLCGAGAALTILSGMRLRAVHPRGARKWLHAAVALVALFCAAYVFIYRADLVGMTLETFRAGPD